MKFLVRLLLIFFIAFQFSSSIIYLIKKETGNDISISIIEEEKVNSKVVKDFKSYFIYDNGKLFNFISDNSSRKVQSLYILKEYKVFASIFIPPPNKI